MSENKTKENDANVDTFLDSIEEADKRNDCFTLKKIMEDITGYSAKMWGESIVGFGSYHYKYESGREGDSLRIGFSPRKNNISIYIMPGLNKYPDIMKKIGKHKTGKSCLYINKLSDINKKILEELLKESFKHMNKMYPIN